MGPTLVLLQLSVRTSLRSKTCSDIFVHTAKLIGKSRTLSSLNVAGNLIGSFQHAGDQIAEALAGNSALTVRSVSKAVDITRAIITLQLGN